MQQKNEEKNYNQNENMQVQNADTISTENPKSLNITVEQELIKHMQLKDIRPYLQNKTKEQTTQINYEYELIIKAKLQKKQHPLLNVIAENIFNNLIQNIQQYISENLPRSKELLIKKFFLGKLQTIEWMLLAMKFDTQEINLKLNLDSNYIMYFLQSHALSIRSLRNSVFWKDLIKTSDGSFIINNQLNKSLFQPIDTRCSQRSAEFVSRIYNIIEIIQQNQYLSRLALELDVKETYIYEEGFKKLREALQEKFGQIIEFKDPINKVYNLTEKLTYKKLRMLCFYLFRNLPELEERRSQTISQDSILKNQPCTIIYGFNHTISHLNHAYPFLSQSYIQPKDITEEQQNLPLQQGSIFKRKDSHSESSKAQKKAKSYAAFFQVSRQEEEAAKILLSLQHDMRPFV